MVEDFWCKVCGGDCGKKDVGRDGYSCRDIDSAASKTK